MEWSWKWLRVIKTWFGCIDSSAQNDNVAPLTIDQLATLGIDQYREKKIYLGYSGELDSGSLEIQFSYSVRDGILVNIKTELKWKILFDYCDGSYLVNDDKAKYEDLLVKLNRLREVKEELDDRAVYKQLQRIVIEHLIKYKA